jgi:Lar family restriction alleviation protein
MNNKLRPCPFCGGEAVFSIAMNNLNEKFDYVECLDCAASSHPVKSKLLTAKVWNTRQDNYTKSEVDELLRKQRLICRNEYEKTIPTFYERYAMQREMDAIKNAPPPTNIKE